LIVAGPFSRARRGQSFQAEMRRDAFTPVTAGGFPASMNGVRRRPA